MLLNEKYGNLALVAGASEGIGAAFSEYLAKAGMDLVLIARKNKELEEFAAMLAGQHNVNVKTICSDLSEPDSYSFIEGELKNVQPDILVYNAALSFIGPFEKDTPEHCRQIAIANVLTPVNLVKLYGDAMVARGRGAVILMSSLAGFQGSGFLASYGGSKAFNRVFAESLWYEWKGKGVDVIACCAGATSTQNYLKTHPGKSGFFAPAVTTPEEVVKECFRNLGKRPSCIAGRGNKAASFFMQRIMPRKMAVKIMGDNTKRIYRIE